LSVLTSHLVRAPRRVDGDRIGKPTSMEEFSPGDRVAWNSHGSEAVGTVQKKITSDTEAAGRTVRASEDDPQYLVESEKSGNDAVHKPSALRKA